MILVESPTVNEPSIIELSLKVETPVTFKVLVLTLLVFPTPVKLEPSPWNWAAVIIPVVLTLPLVPMPEEGRLVKLEPSPENDVAVIAPPTITSPVTFKCVVLVIPVIERAYTCVDNLKLLLWYKSTDPPSLISICLFLYLLL